MSKKLTNRATGERETGNRLTSEESTGRPIDSLPINSLFRYWLPPLLWMGVIFILSAQPTLPQYPDTLFDLILKKAAHMAEYGILTFLLWRALSRGTLSRSALAVAFVVSILYAASDEYHQTFVPGRHGTPMDVGIDTVGILITLLVVGSLGKKRMQE